jgi:hypothetical protein
VLVGSADGDDCAQGQELHCAHVDPKLERFYEDLANGKYALGITGNLTYGVPPPFQQCVTIYPSNGHLALLRQFAHEVQSTAQHFNLAIDSH